MAATSRRRTRSTNTGLASEVGPWSAPEISDHFETAIGSSVVEQIVIGHTPGDILRELVQNEFDAKGHEMRVTFGHEHLNISGTGRHVDKAGWERLSVILGTGDVISPGGVSRKVQPKENGIGSKNFGLRSKQYQLAERTEHGVLLPAKLPICLECNDPPSLTRPPTTSLNCSLNHSQRQR
jgi:hypothetical protein